MMCICALCCTDSVHFKVVHSVVFFFRSVCSMFGYRSPNSTKYIGILRSLKTVHLHRNMLLILCNIHMCLSTEHLVGSLS